MVMSKSSLPDSNGRIIMFCMLWFIDKSTFLEFIIQCFREVFFRYSIYRSHWRGLTITMSSSPTKAHRAPPNGDKGQNIQVFVVQHYEQKERNKNCDRMQNKYPVVVTNLDLHLYPASILLLQTEDNKFTKYIRYLKSWYIILRRSKFYTKQKPHHRIIESLHLYWHGILEL